MPESILRLREALSALALACLVLLSFISAEAAAAEFDSSGWKRFRNLRIPPENPVGVSALSLESGVLEKCKPDLSDVRVLSSDGALAQFTIIEAPGEEELTPFPVRVFRISRNPGKWTDVWIDKSAKSLTKGVRLQTSSRDFMRKVEIRGSDNAKEEYVVNINGLILDVASPLPVNSLDLVHPVNNFQYVHLRIIDDDLPPLKIDGALCFPPLPENPLSRPLEFRILEKRTDASANATTMVLDLGEKRFPLESLALTSPARGFFAKLLLSGANSPAPEVWQKFHESTVFRIEKDGAIKEDLKLVVRPQLFRYIRLELLGIGQTVPLDKVDLNAAMRVAVFQYTRGLSYRLYFDNPSAVPAPHDDKLLAVGMNRIANASMQTSLEEEQNNIAPPAPTKISHEEPLQVGGWSKAVGTGMLLFGLLMLFGVMLRARSLRKSKTRRNSRIVYDRFD